MIPFPLSMQIIEDNLSDKYQNIIPYNTNLPFSFEYVRLFHPNHPISSQYLYVLSAKDVSLLSPVLQKAAFLVSGKADFSQFPAECCGLFIEEQNDALELFGQAQDIFEKYRKWNVALHNALETDNPLDSMLKTSRSIFQNPIFVHDTAFNILAYSHHLPGMAVWEQNPQTGQPMLSLSQINDFRVDYEYLHTLTTTGPCIYSAEQRGYPILYINIWQNGRYEGRICVNEMESPIRPGQSAAIEHLANLIVQALSNRRLVQFNQDNNLKHFFSDFFSGKLSDTAASHKIMQLLDWKRNDSYLCLRLEAKQQDVRMMSSAAAIGHIETQVSGSCAFVYKNGISAIVNLTYSHISISNVLSSLAILLRESLMIMGVSTEIRDFLLLPQGHNQAVTALNLGAKSDSTNWCFRFDDLRLEFLYQKASENFSPKLLHSPELTLLKEYDQENNTELFQTLKVFLALERNVLQTSKKLYIHRSTLSYRLERICKITNINLEDPKERLQLQLSFYFMELEEHTLQD